MDRDHRDLHVLTHSFPTRRSSDLTIGAAGRDDAERRRRGGHRLDLHRGCVGAKQHALAAVALVLGEIEGVVHRPRGMAFGDVEGGEIVPVVLDLGAGGDCKAKVGEDFGEFRSEEHTSELQSLMRTSYAVFCLKKTTTTGTYRSTR